MLLIFSLFSDCRKCSLMYLFVSCSILNALLIFFSSSPPGWQCSVIFYFVCNFISSLCNNGERGGRGEGEEEKEGGREEETKKRKSTMHSECCMRQTNTSKKIGKAS